MSPDLIPIPPKPAEPTFLEATKWWPHHWHAPSPCLDFSESHLTDSPEFCRGLRSHSGLKGCRVTSYLLPKKASGGREQRAFLTLLYDPDHQGVGEAFSLAWVGRSLGEKRVTSQSNLGLFTWFHTRVIIFTLSIEFW